MARGGHGLPKVSLGPALPYPPTPSGQATPKQGWPPHRVGNRWPSSSLLYTAHRTPMSSTIWIFFCSVNSRRRGVNIILIGKRKEKSFMDARGHLLETRTQPYFPNPHPGPPFGNPDSAVLPQPPPGTTFWKPGLCRSPSTPNRGPLFLILAPFPPKTRQRLGPSPSHFHSSLLSLSSNWNPPTFPHNQFPLPP
jgi:hypothetical protein